MLVFVKTNHRSRNSETHLQPLFMILVYLIGLHIYTKPIQEQQLLGEKYGRIVPFFDACFNPTQNPCLPTHNDIPNQVTTLNAYIISFTCATNPHAGRGLKHSSTPFLGLPRGRLPLLIIINLLAGDISLNPGPTTSTTKTTTTGKRRGRKPKHPCGLCKYAVKNAGIQCTHCDEWFHFDCSNTTDTVLEFHKEHPDSVWLCPACDITNFSNSFFDSSFDHPLGLEVSNQFESLSSSSDDPDSDLIQPILTPIKLVRRGNTWKRAPKTQKQVASCDSNGYLESMPRMLHISEPDLSNKQIN